MTMKRMKNICIGLCITLVMTVLSAVPARAADLSVSVGQSRVSVGNEFSVTVRVSDDVVGWTYQITYSDNLTLISGKTMPDGSDDEGSPHINTLIFRADSEGTGTITASCNNGLSDGNRDYSSSDSASISIIPAASDDGGEPPYHGGGDTTPSKSSNNALSSLTVNMGELTPAFDPAVTEYTLSLPLNSDKLTVTADPSDSKATVEGAGEVALQGGENKISVVVTAENGDTKTYTVTVKVAQAPTLFLSFNGDRLGAVKDIDTVTPPAGFAPAAPLTRNGDTLPVWVDASGKQMLVYLVSEKTSVACFYLYDGTAVQSPYIPLSVGELAYVYTGIPAEKESQPGLTPTTVEAFGRTLDGWKYGDITLKSFYVLYLMDADGIYGFYTYDSAKNTLQRFSGAVYSDGGDMLRVPMLYVYIAGGTAAALLILVIVLACVSGSRGKKLRELTEDDLPQTEENDEPALSENPTPEKPEETPAEQTAEPVETACEEELPEQPEPSSSDAAEAALEEPAEESEETAEELATEEETAPPARQSLEDTLRNLPLTDLLRDIHDL